jgi:hypothetical protein
MLLRCLGVARRCARSRRSTVDVSRRGPSRYVTSGVSGDSAAVGLRAKGVDHHAAIFQRMLGPGSVLTGADDLEPFNTDWTGTSKGMSGLALKPRSTDEVGVRVAFYGGFLEQGHKNHKNQLLTSGSPELVVGRRTHLYSPTADFRPTQADSRTLIHPLSLTLTHG